MEDSTELETQEKSIMQTEDSQDSQEDAQDIIVIKCLRTLFFYMSFCSFIL